MKQTAETRVAFDVRGCVSAVPVVLQILHISDVVMKAEFLCLDLFVFVQKVTTRDVIWSLLPHVTIDC